ncbi:MAG: SdiA-regulated domain-containing protein [Bacteroidetes bacterium]|jgi:uncharacterized protein YjiK|nr:SdiA-regulated domain-containing protein [Bacteroidota bacterium]MDF1865206.1 SdiA-regulated domain-containing protein [Saprospiraceae bacterium]
MKQIFFFALLTVLLSNCESPTPPAENQSAPSIESVPNEADTTQSTAVSKPEKVKTNIPKPSFRLPYDLKKPNKTLKLAGKLAEISGLSMTSNGQFLLGHNDEQGKVFFINKETGKIEDELKFHKSGDYEGIEMIGDDIYVTKNNGTIYEIKNAHEKDPKTKEYKTNLSAANDIEGLGFDAKNNRLLLACKAKAGDGKAFKKKRAIYGFDLASKKLIKEPVFLINRDAIKNFVQKNSDRYEKFLEAFVPEQAASAFSPSGIAIHPNTELVYILSSVGKLLVILTPNGSIHHIEKLNKEIHKQPEGICFEKDGTLWISTEGKGGTAKIFEFK